MPQRPRVLQPYASPEAYLGSQVRSWRARAGLSQARLGQLVHVSGDLIGKIEKAERAAHPGLIADLDTALAARGALVSCAPTRTTKAPDADPADVGVPAATSRPAAVTALGKAIASTYAGPTAPDLTDRLDGNRAGVSRAWRRYQAGRFSGSAMEVATMLPGLHARVDSAAPGEQCRRAMRALALCYHAAAAASTKLGARDLAWICADRGLAVAAASEDVTAVTSLRRSVAHVLLSTGRCGESADVAGAAVYPAAAELPAGPLRWSLVGSLHLVAAMASARAADRDRARFHLDEAARLATLLGDDANHAWTAFGPSNVAVHALSVQVELGDLDAGADAAPLPENCSLPRERRVRHHVEVARVWSALGREESAADLVLEAYREAPEHVRHHFLAHGLAAEWRTKPVARRPEVRDLIHTLLRVNCGPYLASVGGPRKMDPS